MSIEAFSKLLLKCDISPNGQRWGEGKGDILRFLRSR